MPDNPKEMSPTQRTAWFVYHLLRGERLTAAQWAAVLGCKRWNAYRLINATAGVLPITRDGEGRWYLLEA